MRRALPSLAVVAVLACSSLSRAADPGNAAEAERLFRDGVKLLNGRHYEDARRKFLAASGLVRSPDILWNLASSPSRIPITTSTPSITRTSSSTRGTPRRRTSTT